MKRFNNILYILDSKMKEPSASLMRAISIAKNNQADITLLQVLPKISISSHSKEIDIDGDEIRKSIFENEESNLNKLVTSLEGDVKVKSMFRVGKQYIESIRAVEAEKFDLVVKEACDIGWLDRFIGSDDMHLLRMCPCPVWLMKKSEKLNYDHIMAAVDFDTDEGESCNNELNSMIVDLASSVCISDLASLHVVNIYDVPEAGFVSRWVEHPDEVKRKLYEYKLDQSTYKMDTLVEELKKSLSEESYKYLSPVSHVVMGVPDRELPKVASEVKADLVVMGTVARTGIAGIVIGNTAESVLYQLECSVLAIKPKSFISPIV